MWMKLTQDPSAAETSAEVEVDVRVIEVVLAADDPQLIYDLRATMGVTRRKPTIYFGMNSNVSLMNSQL